MDRVAAFEGIWAMATLMHVPRARLPEVVTRYCRALVPGGTLYASFTQGPGDGPDEHGRHLSRYTAPDLKALVAATPGLELLRLRENADAMGRAGTTGLDLLVRRAG